MKILPYTDNIHTKGLTAWSILLGLRNALCHWNQHKISILMVYRTIQRVEMKFCIFPLIQQILTDMAINDGLWISAMDMEITGSLIQILWVQIKRIRSIFWPIPPGFPQFKPMWSAGWSPSLLCSTWDSHIIVTGDNQFHKVVIHLSQPFSNNISADPSS